MRKLSTDVGSLEGGTMLRIFGKGKGFHYNIFCMTCEDSRYHA